MNTVHPPASHPGAFGPRLWCRRSSRHRYQYAVVTSASSHSNAGTESAAHASESLSRCAHRRKSRRGVGASPDGSAAPMPAAGAACAAGVAGSARTRGGTSTRAAMPAPAATCAAPAAAPAAVGSDAGTLCAGATWTAPPPPVPASVRVTKQPTTTPALTRSAWQARLRGAQRVDGPSWRRGRRAATRRPPPNPPSPMSGVDSSSSSSADIAEINVEFLSQ